MEIFDVLAHISFLIESHSTPIIWAHEWLLLRVNAQMSVEFAYAGEDFQARPYCLIVLMITGAIMVMVI